MDEWKWELNRIDDSFLVSKNLELSKMIRAGVCKWLLDHGVTKLDKHPIKVDWTYIHADMEFRFSLRCGPLHFIAATPDGLTTDRNLLLILMLFQ
jgi:hypothetical protein